MWKNLQDLISSIKKEPWAQDRVDDDFWHHLMDYIEGSLLPEFLKEIAAQVDEMVEIDPDLPEPEIFGGVTRYMVEALGALWASVRVYDPLTAQMLSYGSYPFEEKSRQAHVPLENTIAGVVVKTQESRIIPNILKEKLYHDKERVTQKGAHSVMAVPVVVPRFFPNERDIVGVIQIYFSEKDRAFNALEIQIAELMARRLSYVMARKKMLSLYRVNEKKEAIVQKLFLKTGAKEGVKMKDVFNGVIPELADIINVQSCALFSVSEDLEHVILEAGYPESAGYHGIGKRFSIASEPGFEIILNRRIYADESPYEVATQSYFLVVDPHKSAYVSKNLKIFAQAHNINSILYVPLNVGEDITHFMTFDALDQRKRYTEGEIEIFLFLGREIMKAHRMERLDDILHDFKNPAIATAGFARRLKRMIEQEGPEKGNPTVKRYVDILFEETCRMQEMALSLYHVGKAQIVNLTEIVRNRFEINKEVIEEMLKQNVSLQEGPYENPLLVRCYSLHLERILDNLLNNATNAIPLQGGSLAIRTYAQEGWACVELTNTGRISEEERLRLLEGEGRGRGLYITHRILRSLNGRIEINVGKTTTTFVVRLPLHRT